MECLEKYKYYNIMSHKSATVSLDTDTHTASSHYDLDKGHFKHSPAIDSLQVIHDHALSVYELSADAR